MEANTSWFQRNKKKITITSAIVAAVATVGVIAWKKFFSKKQAEPEKK